MAIKIKTTKDEYVYKANNGLLSQEQKQRADKIYSVSENTLRHLDETNLDIFTIWYKRGRAANEIIDRYSLTNEEKKYFWQMLYGAMNIKIPDTASKSHTRRNDFLTASILADYKLNELKQVGTWSLWREVVGSVKVSEDERVAQWIIDYILKHKIITRDGARPLLKFVRNRLKNLETGLLTQDELFRKLNEFTQP